MSSITLGSKGFVYVLVNSAMPGLCKVGQTTLDPHERARQLSAATAAAVPFHVAHWKRHDDVNAAESAVHEMLDRYRVNESREFFKCPLSEAILAVDRICGCDNGRYPFAELFATFPDETGGRELTEDEQRQCRELRRTL